MPEYYSPKCNKKDKLVKSRCECRKTIKIKVKRKKTKVRITVKKKKPKVVKKKKKNLSFLEKHKGPLYFKSKFVEEINQKWNKGLRTDWINRYGPNKGRCKKGYIKNPKDKFCYTFSDKILKKYTQKTKPVKAKRKTVKKTTKKPPNKKKPSSKKKPSNKKKPSSKIKRKRCPNGTKKDSVTGKCVPKNTTSIKKKPVLKRETSVIENNTPKLAKELRRDQKKGKVRYSPSINKQLMTLKSVTPKGNVYDCPNGDVLATTAKGTKCYSWKTKRAREIMLKNLNTTKPVSAGLIIAPAQHQSNCWMNSFFMAWFISDGGRKFNRWFRQTCITGKVPGIGKSIPPKMKKPAFLLNKMIDASLRSKSEGDPARYAELMDTNDIIRQFHRALPNSRVVKTKKASNPLTFYSTIYRKIIDIKDGHIGWREGDISYTKGPIGWLNFYMSSDNPPTGKQLNKLISNASIIGDFIPKVIFVEVQDTPSGKFKTPKKLEFVVDRANMLGRKNIQPGKKYSYKLDAAVLRNTSKIHFSAYITINGIDYGFDGESYSRLQKFNWKSKLNKNTQWRFAEQYETYFNFTKGYQILIYYRDS